MANLAHEQCVPCTGGVPVLDDGEISELHMTTPMWEVFSAEGSKRLRRSFKFDTYVDGLVFATRVGQAGGRAGSSPDDHDWL